MFCLPCCVNSSDILKRYISIQVLHVGQAYWVVQARRHLLTDKRIHVTSHLFTM